MKNKRLKFIGIAIVVVLVLIICLALVLDRTRGPNSYVGLTEAQAVERATDRHQQFRIVRRDTENMSITDDHRSDRINFEIDNGKVIKVRRY